MYRLLHTFSYEETNINDQMYGYTSTHDFTIWVCIQMVFIVFTVMYGMPYKNLDLVVSSQQCTAVVVYFVRKHLSKAQDTIAKTIRQMLRT